LFSRFYEIVDVDNSYFKRVELDKNVNLSSEMIKLNYMGFSPFRDSKMSFYKGAGYIYLWFHKNKNSKKVQIPYSYLIFNYLKSDYQNYILCIEYKNEYLILVIKNATLLDVFLVKSIDEAFLPSLQEQYSISENKIFSKTESHMILNNSLKIDLPIFVKFLMNDFDLKKASKNFFMDSIIPVSIFLYMYMGLNFLHSYLLESEYKNLENKYKQVKSVNDDFRNKFYNNYEFFTKLHNFEENELIYNNQFLILSKLTKVIKDNDSKLQRVFFSGNVVDFVVKDVNDSVGLLNRLINVDDFSKVVIYNNNDKTSQTAFRANLKILGE